MWAKFRDKSWHDLFHSLFYYLLEFNYLKSTRQKIITFQVAKKSLSKTMENLQKFIFIGGDCKLWTISHGFRKGPYEMYMDSKV